MSDDTQKEQTVSFGFEEVTPDEKVDRVKGVFRSVASRYDVMNDLMSAGVHRLWKHDTIAKLNPQPGERLIDVAGGTGDLAKAFIDRADKAGRRRGRDGLASAVVCDINDAMLEAGRARADMAAYEDRIGWVCGDAQALPFEDRSFDAVTIAFGIRNVADRSAALSEFRRVRGQGLPLDQTVTQAAAERLRPVLMTATVASIGMLPAALATGVGTDVQRGLATVVVGGLIVSTLLTLFVLPSLFYSIEHLCERKGWDQQDRRTR